MSDFIFTNVDIYAKITESKNGMSPFSKVNDVSGDPSTVNETSENILPGLVAIIIPINLKFEMMSFLLAKTSMDETNGRIFLVSSKIADSIKS